MANIETYDTTASHLALEAIKNPTEENINKAVQASIENAHKLTEYIICQNKKSN